MRFMVLVSLLALIGQLAAADSGIIYQDDNNKDVDRIGGSSCSKDNIIIDQASAGFTPSGIPGFMVQIVNVCGTKCSVSNLHLNCGWFSSATQIDPSIFRRLKFNDCLVNNGGSLRSGVALTFHYANAFPFPLNVSSLSCQ